MSSPFDITRNSPQAVRAATADFPPLRLEFVDPLDLDVHAQIVDFINAYAVSPENADGAIRARSPEKYRQAFATGLVVRGRRGEQTRFVQMVYPLAVDGRPFIELGTVLSRDGRRGLMEPVVRALLMRALSLWPRAVVYAVAKPGSASAHVLAKVGMRPWSPAPRLVAQRERIGLALPAGKQVFRFELGLVGLEGIGEP